MGKTAKSTRKFKNSGQLQKTIEQRKKHQKIQKKIQGRRGAAGKGKGQHKDHLEEDVDTDIRDTKGKGKAKEKSVDDFLNAEFSDDDDEDEHQIDSDVSGGDELMSDLNGEEDDYDVDEDFASVDDFEEDGNNHLMELSALAEKDPEFYKYLQENDQELLNFDPHAIDGAISGDDDDDDDADNDLMKTDEPSKRSILTTEILLKWQKALLDQRSLRALKKLLIAFRCAVHMNEDNMDLAWTIDSSSVFLKLLNTAFKYTPVIVGHHIPIKTLPSGKFKPPTQSPKQKTIQRLIQSFFNNILHLLDQLTDPKTIQLALQESAKLLPYVLGSRKIIKTYLQKCLLLWSSASEDSIRISAFLSIRKLACATDESITDHVLKGTYLTLVRSSKSTNIHSLPSINLMKNSASDLFCLVDDKVAYQHAFGYIRQLAMHLRNSMKIKSKEAYKQVYNWQYVHCVDFWCTTLGKACDTDAQIAAGGKENALKALIYPLVQVSLGAIKLIPNSRSHPFHLQIARSIVFLSRHTKTYTPLAPYLLPILTSALSPTTKPKSSTLRPLDLEFYIRTPAQYVKTRLYNEVLVEETCYVFAEWMGNKPVMNSVAFPEVTVPISVSLRRLIKQARSSKHGNGKDVGVLKGFVERIDESAKWVEIKRQAVSFGPTNLEEVGRWEGQVVIEDSPLGKYLKVLRKTRQKKRQMLEKARLGEAEMVVEDDDED